MQRKFHILDGLRGILAILVVAFHILQLFYPSTATLPLHHGYLAVDFFFMLSGFIIGHAYDHRWTSLRKKDFFAARLTRLHPLVIIGGILGLFTYLFQHAGADLAGVSPWLLILAVFLHSLMLPYSGIPGSFGLTHPLNGPSWSLFQEYLVNIAYALIGQKLSKKVLGGLVLLSGILLTVTAVRLNTLQVGWDWDHFYMAPIRVFFSFFAGLFIFRSGFRLSVRFAFPLLSLIMLCIMVVPVLRLNGLYDAFCVLFLFPLVLAIGAGSTQHEQANKICTVSGEISYPLYMLHAPIVSLLAIWVQTAPHPVVYLKFAAVGVLGGCILLAWFSHHYIDQPIRAWLNSEKRIKLNLPSIFGRSFARFPAYKAPTAPAPSSN